MLYWQTLHAPLVSLGFHADQPLQDRLDPSLPDTQEKQHYSIQHAFNALFENTVTYQIHFLIKNPNPQRKLINEINDKEIPSSQ